MNNKEFLNWIADRLVNVYEEAEGTDFVTKLREIAKEINKCEIEKGKLELINMDLKGQLAKETCNMCNFVERAKCYEQKDNLKNKLFWYKGAFDALNPLRYYVNEMIENKKEYPDKKRFSLVHDIQMNSTKEALKRAERFFNNNKNGEIPNDNNNN